MTALWVTALVVGCGGAVVEPPPRAWTRDAVEPGPVVAWSVGDRAGMLMARGDPGPSALLWYDLDDLGAPPRRFGGPSTAEAARVAGTHDVDGDGALDVAVVERGALRWFLGPDLGAGEVHDLGVVGDPRSAALRDLDGDGAPELIVVWAQVTSVYGLRGEPLAAHPGWLSVVQWRGRPALRLPTGWVVDPLTGTAVGAYDGRGEARWAGDLDGDGTDEVVMVAEGSRDLLFEGAYGVRWRLPGFGAAAVVAAVVDGAVELLLVDPAPGGTTMSVDPLTGLDGALWVRNPLRAGAEVTVVGDTVVSSSPEGWLVMAPGDLSWTAMPADAHPARLRLGDIDGDGVDEVVSLPPYGRGWVCVYGAGGRARCLDPDFDDRWGEGVEPLALGDFDGDGRHELHGRRSGVAAMVGLEPDTDEWSRGFASAGGLGVDVDGDGRDEIVRACGACVALGEVTVSWRRGARDVTRSLNGEVFVGVADLDGDGGPELVTAASGATQFMSPGLPADGWAPADRLGVVATPVGPRLATWRAPDREVALSRTEGERWVEDVRVEVRLDRVSGFVDGLAWGPSGDEVHAVDPLTGATARLAPGAVPLAAGSSALLWSDGVTWGVAPR